MDRTEPENKNMKRAKLALELIIIGVETFGLTGFPSKLLQAETDQFTFRLGLSQVRFFE